jgi:DNA-binding YbaB/EbfC family protein
MIFGNMGEMMKMAKEMQGKLKEIKEELKKEVYESYSGGITVKISGDMEVREIKVEPQIIDPHNVSRLERSIREAFEKALRDAKNGAASKMKGLTGGLGLPGMF